MASLINSAGATGTGSMTIQGPNTNSNQVLTIPDATGTAMVSGNMPAFSAYAPSVTPSANTFTKIPYATKEYDTAGCYNNTSGTVTLNGLSVPAWSYCPNVAGYYQVNTSYVVATYALTSEAGLSIYKNGSEYKRLADIASNTYGVSGSAIVYLNGTGDYISSYVFTASSNSGSLTSIYGSFFQAIMVRTA